MLQKKKRNQIHGGKDVSARKCMIIFLCYVDLIEKNFHNNYLLLF